MHKNWCSGDFERSIGPNRGDEMMATVLVLGVIVLSFTVGCLTTSVETEKKLPHHY